MHCLSHLLHFYEPEQSNSLATILLTQWGHTDQNESYLTLHRQDTPQLGKTERKMPKEIDSVSRGLNYLRSLAYKMIDLNCICKYILNHQVGGIKLVGYRVIPNNTLNTLHHKYSIFFVFPYIPLVCLLVFFNFSICYPYVESTLFRKRKKLNILETQEKSGYSNLLHTHLIARQNWKNLSKMGQKLLWQSANLLILNKTMVALRLLKKVENIFEHWQGYLFSLASLFFFKGKQSSKRQF